MKHPSLKGYTLIELAIVLVIIGLIVGGVVTGRDLIAASAVRAQVTQIEKFNSATNTFYGKFGYLPGDIPAAPAAQFAMATPGPYTGQGDGNGVIQGNAGNSSQNVSCCDQTGGETIGFWSDLSLANLISEVPASVTNLNFSPGESKPYNFFPYAKIGQGNYVYVYSDDAGKNYFGLSQGAGNCTLSHGGYSCSSGYFYSAPTGLSAVQAYNIDKKIDDGSPETGNVLARSVGDGTGDDEMYWPSGNYGATDSPVIAISPSSTTCYDNGGNTANAMAYSLAATNGFCGLSFKLQ